MTTAPFHCRNCGAPITLSDTARVVACRGCGYRQAAPVSVWAVRCRSCRYGRAYGAARLTALLAADKHCRKHPGHRLYVLCNGVVVERRQERSAPTLPGF